jgi:hypothetical protein
MKYIAHRALFNGPEPALENHPDQIHLALSKGWDVEIDLRVIDNKYLLGHDEPLYEVTKEFILTYGLWVHCKNLAALHALAGGPVQCFWHDADAYTLTSHNAIWAYPGQPLTAKSIWVQPEWAENWRDQVYTVACLGICSKYVQEIQAIRNR